MKPIAAPAFRPTADCIWNSFLNSGKRHLLLTGSRGSGKTTLLSALRPNPLPGITTFAAPGEAVFLRENGSDRAVQIGTYDETLPGTENKMVPIPEGFRFLGIPALRRCAQSPGEWASIDEIGYLESGFGEYCAEILSLMEKKRLIAAVRSQDLPFLAQLLGRGDAFVVDLDAPFGNCGCVIMASGMGRRFGGNKLMADFRGEPMILRILAATEGIFSRRVVVTRHEAVAALCREMGVETALHDLPHRSDTVRLGLESLCDADGCMFCPADQPLLHRETIAALALSAANDRLSIWRTAFDGVPGSPVLFPRWMFPELLSLPEGKGGGYVAGKHPERVRLLPVRDKFELMDADRPEDLGVLAQR